MSTTVVTPQSLAEHAVSTSTADECIVIVSDTTSANLRWAAPGGPRRERRVGLRR